MTSSLGSSMPPPARCRCFELRCLTIGAMHLMHAEQSFLPSQEAVQTCVLVKCWCHIWKSVPSLRIFDDKFKTEEIGRAHV